jgi:hypothetical protein
LVECLGKPGKKINHLHFSAMLQGLFQQNITMKRNLEKKLRRIYKKFWNGKKT